MLPQELRILQRTVKKSQPRSYTFQGQYSHKVARWQSGRTVTQRCGVQIPVQAVIFI